MDKDRIEGAATKLGGRLQKVYGSTTESMRDSGATLADHIENFVHDQPVAALLGAATIGFLLARLIDR